MDDEKRSVNWIAPWTWGRAEWLGAFTVWLPLYLFSFPITAAIAGVTESAWARTAFLFVYAPLIFTIRIFADPRP